MARKIVINRGYGGFSLSDQVKNLYMLATKDVPRFKGWYFDQDVSREDPILIEIIERVGLEHSRGNFATLKIIELPADLLPDNYEIHDYDGIEWVAEKHRMWS